MLYLKSIILYINSKNVLKLDIVVQKLWSFKYTKLVLKIEQIYLCFKIKFF